MTHDTTGGPAADNLIERIKADREAEAKAKGWDEKYLHQSTIDTRSLPEIEIDPNLERLIRRLGRLGEIESRILDDAEALKAADRAIEKLQHALNICADDPSRFEEAQREVRAYRKARENNDD